MGWMDSLESSLSTAEEPEHWIDAGIYEINSKTGQRRLKRMAGALPAVDPNTHKATAAAAELDQGPGMAKSLWGAAKAAPFAGAGLLVGGAEAAGKIYDTVGPGLALVAPPIAGIGKAMSDYRKMPGASVEEKRGEGLGGALRAPFEQKVEDIKASGGKTAVGALAAGALANAAQFGEGAAEFGLVPAGPLRAVGGPVEASLKKLLLSKGWAAESALRAAKAAGKGLTGGIEGAGFDVAQGHAPGMMTAMGAVMGAGGGHLEAGKFIREGGLRLRDAAALPESVTLPPEMRDVRGKTDLNELVKPVMEDGHIIAHVGPDGTVKPLPGGPKEQLAEAQRLLAEKESELGHVKREARTDIKTGLGNDRSLMEALPSIADPAAEHAVVVFDGNNFKAVNDKVSHVAGDAVLKDVFGAAMQRAAQELGIPARLFRHGGDEFAALVPSHAALEFRRLAELYSHAEIPTSDGGSMRVSMTGVSATATDAMDLFQNPGKKGSRANAIEQALQQRKAQHKAEMQGAPAAPQAPEVPGPATPAPPALLERAADAAKREPGLATKAPEVADRQAAKARVRAGRGKKVVEKIAEGKIGDAVTGDPLEMSLVAAHGKAALSDTPSVADVNVAGSIGTPHPPEPIASPPAPTPEAVAAVAAKRGANVARAKSAARTAFNAKSDELNAARAEYKAWLESVPTETKGAGPSGAAPVRTTTYDAAGNPVEKVDWKEGGTAGAWDAGRARELDAAHQAKIEKLATERKALLQQARAEDATFRPKGPTTTKSLTEVGLTKSAEKLKADAEEAAAMGSRKRAEQLAAKAAELEAQAASRATPAESPVEGPVDLSVPPENPQTLPTREELGAREARLRAEYAAATAAKMPFDHLSYLATELQKVQRDVAILDAREAGKAGPAVGKPAPLTPGRPADVPRGTPLTAADKARSVLEQAQARYAGLKAAKAAKKTLSTAAKKEFSGLPAKIKVYEQALEAAKASEATVAAEPGAPILQRDMTDTAPTDMKIDYEGEHKAAATEVASAVDKLAKAGTAAIAKAKAAAAKIPRPPAGEGEAGYLLLPGAAGPDPVIEARRAEVMGNRPEVQPWASKLTRFKREFSDGAAPFLDFFGGFEHLPWATGPGKTGRSAAEVAVLRQIQTRRMADRPNTDGVYNYDPSTGNETRIAESVHDILNDVGNEGVYRDLGQMMAEQSNLERYDNMVQNRALGKKGGVQVSHAEKVKSEATLAHLEAKYGGAVMKDGVDGWTHLKQLGQRLRYNSVAAQLLPLHQLGVISTEDLVNILDANQYHAAFDRVNTKILQLMTDANSEGSPLHEAHRGLEQALKIADPIESQIRRNRSIGMFIEHQRLRQILVDTHEAGGLPSASQGVIMKYDPSVQLPAQHRYKHFQFFRDGERERWVAPAELVDAMQFYAPKDIHFLWKMAAIPADVIRAGYTLTGRFVVRQLLRDPINQALLSSQPGMGPAPFASSLRGLLGVVGLEPHPKYRAWAQYAESLGMGMNNISYGSDVKGLAATKQDLMMKPWEKVKAGEVSIGEWMTARVGGFLRHWGKSALEGSPLYPLKEIASASEAMTRVGAFQSAKAKGATDMAAMWQALESQPNFGRRGRAMEVFNRLQPFSNASVRELANTLREGKAQPKRVAMAFAAYVALPSLFNWAINRNDPYYKDEPGWKKALFYHVPVSMIENATGMEQGSLAKKIGGPHILFPRPQGILSATGYAMEQLLHMVDGDDPNALQNIYQAYVEQTPAQYTLAAGPRKYLGTFAAAALPMSMIEDKNPTTGKPVIPPSLQEGRVPEDQFYSSTAPAYVKAGAAAGVSPLRIENVVRRTTGNLGQAAVVTGGDLAGLPPPPGGYRATDTPILGGFVEPWPVGPGSQPVQDFYELYNRAETAARDMEYQRKRGAEGQVGNIQHRYPEWILYPVLKPHMVQMRWLSSRLRALDDDTTKSQAQKDDERLQLMTYQTILGNQSVESSRKYLETRKRIGGGQ